MLPMSTVEATAALTIHSGTSPGELLLHSTQAISPGVVILPPSPAAHRFCIEAVSGGNFSLQRVALLPWPQPPAREGLFLFATEAAAKAALEELEQALMVVDEATPPPQKQAKVIPPGVLCTLFVVTLLFGFLLGSVLR